MNYNFHRHCQVVLQEAHTLVGAESKWFINDRNFEWSIFSLCPFRCLQPQHSVTSGRGKSLLPCKFIKLFLLKHSEADQLCWRGQRKGPARTQRSLTPELSRAQETSAAQLRTSLGRRPGDQATSVCRVCKERVQAGALPRKEPQAMA